MKTLNLLTAFVCTFAFAGLARAADETKTISGEAKCAKADLKLQDKCQTVIQVKEGNKAVDYYVAANDVDKAFHPQICHAPKQVNATGVVKTVDGRHELVASKIELKK
ncbi:MAG: DUF6370 family protein [Verrucomicrobiota bacterium]